MAEIGTIKVTVPIRASAQPAAGGKICGTGSGIKVRSSSLGRARVYNLRGSLVKAQNVSAGETQIGGLKAGVYLVKLSDGTKGMVRIQQ